jgi:hypothetical protein
MESTVANVAAAAELVTLARSDGSDAALGRLLDGFAGSAGDARAVFARVAASLGGHILAKDALLRGALPGRRPALLALVAECLAHGDRAAPGPIVDAAFLAHLWAGLRGAREPAELGALARALAALLPWSPPWMRRMMDADAIQILGGLPAAVPAARVLWALVADDANLARRPELEMIVNQCLRYIADDGTAENVEVALRILAALAAKRRFVPDRFSLEVVLPGIERALEGATMDSLRSECIHFLSTWADVPAPLVARVARGCLPAASRELSLLAFEFVSAHMDAFATLHDLQQLQALFAEGLAKNLALVRPQDCRFLGRLIEEQGAAVYFDDATIEVYLGMLETGEAPAQAVELLLRAIEQCITDGGERVAALQNKLAEYQDVIERLAYMEPHSFAALRDKVGEVLE